jgi:hypothetical protein
MLTMDGSGLHKEGSTLLQAGSTLLQAGSTLLCAGSILLEVGSKHQQVTASSRRIQQTLAGYSRLSQDTAVLLQDTTRPGQLAVASTSSRSELRRTGSWLLFFHFLRFSTTPMLSNYFQTRVSVELTCMQR